MANKATSETENGQTNTPLIVAFGFVVMFVAVAGVYIVLSDRLNGFDAYRTTETRKQRDNAIALCGANLDSLQILQEWIRQQKLTPPTEGMKIKQCPTVESAEKEHK